MAVSAATAVDPARSTELMLAAAHLISAAIIITTVSRRA